MSILDVAVVGGGVAGLSAAWHLARAGANVAVFDADIPGNLAGSSHGRARMTRSTYGSRLYVEWVAEVLDRDWPELQAQGPAPLITPCPAVFFGPRGGLFDTFCEATRAAGSTGLLGLEVEAARESYPMLHITRGDGVVIDSTGGVISADRTLGHLVQALLSVGGQLHTHAPVERIESGAPGGVWIGGTDPRHIAAKHVLVAAGVLTPSLVPETRGVIRPLRQVVGFAEPGVLVDCPNWARLDHGGLTYGLPPHGGDGAKMAKHRLTGPADPTGEPLPTTPNEQRQLREDLAPALRCVPPFARVDPCLYAATVSEDPVLTQLRNGAVTVLAGLSGHGFKLAPLLGRIASDLILGRPTLPSFDRERSRFGVSR